MFNLKLKTQGELPIAQKKGKELVLADKEAKEKKGVM